MGRRNELVEFGFGVGLIFWFLNLVALESARDTSDALLIHWADGVLLVIPATMMLVLMVGFDWAIRLSEAQEKESRWFGIVQAQMVTLYLVGILIGVFALKQSPFHAVASGCFLATLVASKDAKKMARWTLVATILFLILTIGWACYAYFLNPEASDAWTRRLLERDWVALPRGSYIELAGFGPGTQLILAPSYALTLAQMVVLGGLGAMWFPLVSGFLSHKELMQRGVHTRPASLKLFLGGLAGFVALRAASYVLPITFHQWVWMLGDVAVALALVGAMKAWGTRWMEQPWVPYVRLMGRSAISCWFVGSLVVSYVMFPFGLGMDGQLHPALQVLLAVFLTALCIGLSKVWKVGPFERAIEWAGRRLGG